MNTTSARVTNGVLNGLIIACNDGARAHDAAARTVAGERRHQLEDAARARGAFVHELSQLIRDLGGNPATGGSLFEGALTLLASAQSLLIGAHAGDRYSTCARVDDKAHALYERALQRRLPDSVRRVLERQHAQVASDRQEWRRRWIL